MKTSSERHSPTLFWPCPGSVTPQRPIHMRLVSSAQSEFGGVLLGAVLVPLCSQGADRQDSVFTEPSHMKPVVPTQTLHSTTTSSPTIPCGRVQASQLF